MLLRTGGGVLIARLAQAGVNAGCGWLVARELGASGQGHYALSLMFILLSSSLANGGVGLAAVPLLKSKTTDLQRVMAAQLGWVAFAAPLTVVIALVAWLAGAGTWAAETLGWQSHLAPFAAALAMVALLVFDIFVYNLTALGRVLTGPRFNLVRAVLHLVMLLGWLFAGRLGLAEALLSYAVAQSLAAMGVAVMLRRQRERETARLDRIRPLMMALLRAGWVGQLSSVASLLHLRLDLMLVAFWHGPEVVGIYSVAVLLGELLWMLPGALQPVLVFTAGSRDGDPDRITARAIRLGLIATAAAALVLAVSASMLLNLFGEAFAASRPALWALLPGIVAFAPGAILAGDFIGRGRPQWNAQASLVTVLVNVAAGLLLIPTHGAVGAAWASSLAYFVGSLVMVLRFRRVSDLAWADLILGRT